MRQPRAAQVPVASVVKDAVPPAADDFPRLVHDDGSNRGRPGQVRLPHQGEHLGPRGRKFTPLGHASIVSRATHRPSFKRLWAPADDELRGLGRRDHRGCGRFRFYRAALRVGKTTPPSSAASASQTSSSAQLEARSSSAAPARFAAPSGNGDLLGQPSSAAPCVSQDFRDVPSSSPNLGSYY